MLDIPEEDPNDLAAMDAAWEEAAVRFGPGEASSCTDGLHARRAGALRRAAAAPRACAALRSRIMSTGSNNVLFGWYPYVALTVFLLGSLLRFDHSQYTWRTGSSQLLRRRQMMWGSNLFHVGILAIFAGHVVGLLTPVGCSTALGISHTFKQLLAMSFGGVAGVACWIGIALLAHRRLFDARIRTHVELRRHRHPAAAVGAVDARLVHHPGLAQHLDGQRDGEIHELGAGHPDAASGRRRR